MNTTYNDGSDRRPQVSTWSLASVMFLRQAGFPIELLEPLADPVVTGHAAALLTSQAEVRASADQVKILLRRAGMAKRGDITTTVGMLRPLSKEAIYDVASHLSADDLSTLWKYQNKVREITEQWTEFQRLHRARLDQSRAEVVSAFADDELQQVLLVSNDATYPAFKIWHDRFDGVWTPHARRWADLLAMYLQRVTTKNETHSHFGPFTPVQVSREHLGIRWTPGRPLKRYAYFTRWAAQCLINVLSQNSDVREAIRPRRHPLAFLREGTIDGYGFTEDQWHFVRRHRSPISPAEELLWWRCDGERTIAELRAMWDRSEHGAGTSFEDTLSTLTKHGWILTRLEIPTGEPNPLGALREQLARGSRKALTSIAHVLDEFERFPSAFANAPPAQRATVLSLGKAAFEQVTGHPANRNSGQTYADRSIFFEEARSGLGDVIVGADVASFIADELSILYDLVLAAPRLRIRRESDILRCWVGERFGIGKPVPLDRFYAGFMADKVRLLRHCNAVDAEVENVHLQIATAILCGTDTARHEVTVSRKQIESILNRYPGEPATFCNPDVMFSALNLEALNRGYFTAVVGDCHAETELLTHSCFGPLLAMEAPELINEVIRNLNSMLEEDEILVDIAGMHADKREIQLLLPCPDLEFVGPSRKSRSDVIRPSQVYVVAGESRIELRAEGVPYRLRLTAAPAVTPSIRYDPLAPFAFPYHPGHTGIGAHLTHVPRIRCDRVIISRELWRVPATSLHGWSPFTGRGKGDAAEFVTAYNLRKRLDLPRYVIARIPGERKPLFVDWEAPLLVRQFFRHVRGKNGNFEITEMLPDPYHLWLNVNGHRFTSEIRCAMFCPGKRISGGND